MASCVRMSSNSESRRLDALGPAPRAELLHVLMLPDFERADRIGEFRGYPESRAFAELLIDCEEDRGSGSVRGCTLSMNLPRARGQGDGSPRVDPLCFPFASAD